MFAGKIGVIGTRATVNSEVYEKEIKSLNPNIEVITQACPLFVPLAEEGLTNHQATKLIAEEYLTKFSNIKIDVLILGCTYYPLLKGVIQETIGKNVSLIDSAKPTAKELKRILEERGLLNSDTSGNHEFFVTDAPEKAYQVARLFFGNHSFGVLRKVTLSD